jgi:hypothetical protein
VQNTLDEYKDLNLNALRNKVEEDFPTNAEHFLKGSNGRKLTKKQIMDKLIEHFHSTHLTEGRGFIKKM